MINTELRLNNLVYDPNGNIDTIHALTGHDCWLQWFKTASYLEIKPIPLTDDVLINMFWFKKCPWKGKDVLNRDVEGVHWSLDGDHVPFPNYIKHVHELQNWYYYNYEFEELTLKK